MIKRVLFFLISLFVGVGLFIWIIHFIGLQEIRSAFLIFAGWHGIIILFLSVLMLFFGIWKWQVILKSQGYNLSNIKLSGHYLAGFSLTYIFPMVPFAGEVFRGYLLKEKFGIPWKHGIASIFIDKILETTSFLITISAGLVFFFLKIGLLPQNLGILFGSFLFAVGGLVGFFYFKAFRRESMVQILAKFFNHKKLLHGEIMEAEQEIFHFLKDRKGALLRASFLAILRVAVTWLRTWVLVLFLGKTAGFFSVLSILAFDYFAFMIPIPAALGIHEISQTFAFNALGLGMSLAPAFTMIQRGAELILAFVGLALFVRLGLYLLQSILLRKVEIIAQE